MSPPINKPVRNQVVLIKVYVKDQHGNIYETAIDPQECSAIFWRAPKKTDAAFAANIADTELSEFENKIQKLDIYSQDYIKQKLDIPQEIDLNQRPSSDQDWSVEQTILGHYYENFRDDYKRNADPKIDDKRQYGAAYVGATWFKRSSSKRAWDPVDESEESLKAQAAKKPAAAVGSDTTRPDGLTAALLKIPNCTIQNL